MLTGATGFVGRALAVEMMARGFCVTAPVRLSPSSWDQQIFLSDSPVIGEINGQTKWDDILIGVDTIVHCAAMSGTTNYSNSVVFHALKSVNVEGTLNLARQAAAAGVGRFIFLSSIKVNGEVTSTGQPFRTDDVPAPADYYGVSKLEAEKGLLDIAAKTGLEIVIVRAPLVYGSGVKGNFHRLAKLVATGIPLPFASVKNSRSFLAIDNLIDFLIVCVDHPSAANQIFLVSDAHDLSTSELLRGIGQAMGKPTRLIPCPPILLNTTAQMIGKKHLANRLLGSLQVDISKTQKVLGWAPPIDVKESLRRCFLHKNSNKSGKHIGDL